MTVTVDVSAAVHARAGLGRYAGELAAALERERPGMVRLFSNHAGKDLQRLPESLSQIPMTSLPLGYKPWRLAVWLGQLAHLSMDLRLSNTSLFHATEHLLMPLRRIPTVMTVHDLIFKLFPEHHKKLNYFYLNATMPLYVHRATHIIAVSEQTRQDLINYYGTPADKISVVYEAAAATFKPATESQIESARARYQLPDQYLVTVGTIEPRKNLPRVVEALSVLRREYPDLKLVVIGSKGWLADGFYSAIEQHGLQDSVILPGFIPDDDLPAVIGGAQASISASLYEGFGLPVLEAMACGVPVVCSGTSSLAEISGDAALTFDPERVDTIVDALRQVLGNRELRGKLREQGLKRASQFSWERAAHETWEVYDRTVSEGFSKGVK